MKPKFIPQELFDFVDRAGKATYAGGGKYEENPERPGFFELVYNEELPWYYRDSYTGHSRSGGQEIVRFNDKPIWWSGYDEISYKGEKVFWHRAVGGILNHE